MRGAMKGINNEGMANHNRFTILKLFYQNGAMGIQDIAQKTGLTTAAVSKIIKKLQGDGFVIKTNDAAPSHGKHQGFWMINRLKQFFLCLDIAPKKISSLVVDFIGAPLGKVRSVGNEFADKNELLKLLLKECRHWQKQFPSLQYAGLSVTGLVDNTTRHSSFRVLMNAKEDVDIISYLEPKTGLQIKMDNNCNNMMLAEKWLGYQSMWDSCVLLHLDYGIGAAFLKKQEIFRGSAHSAVQIGHICMDINGPPCPCGSRGCLENYAKEENLIKNTGYSSVEAFYTALSQGAADAKERYTLALDYLAVGVGALINLYEPNKIILTGSFTRGGCLDLLKILSRQFSIGPLHDHCEIALSSLTGEQHLAGSAFLWVEELLNPSSGEDS